MLEQIRSVVVWLATIDPALPRALLVALVFAAVYLFRKFFPRAWELFAGIVPVPVIDPAPLLLVLSKTWQALPGALLGAAASALATGGDVKAAVKGAVFGALAAVAHEFAKAAPWLPYTGTVGKSRLPVGAAQLLVVLLPLCSLVACLPLGRVDWPKVLSCGEPLQQPLVEAVAKVLTGQGDVKTELEELARQYAPGAIECAVQQLVGDLANGPATARASRAAARGRAFLDSVQR